jgi:hypothetical protein
MSSLSGDRDKVDKLKDAADEFMKKHEVQVDKVMEFLEKYWRSIIIGTTIILVISIIYNSIYLIRINKMKRLMSGYTKTRKNLTLQSGVLSKDYRLCDFYISSAFRCYLPRTNWFDYSSTESIRQCLIYGARYLHLDIYPTSFSSDADPVICNGEEEGNWHWTTKLGVDEALKVIAETAFNNEVIGNNTDPLFIHFSFKCWGNTGVIDKCVPIIKKYFEENLLSSEFSFNGKFSKTNIALTPIRDLIGKVIIITDSKDPNDVESSKMYELSNLNPNSTGNCALMTYEAARDIYNKDELKNDNKRRMTIVHPNFFMRSKENYNFYTPYFDGCQFLAMNFTESDDFMKNYINIRFKEYSFVLKPLKLRYKPEVISPPAAQNPAVSFAPQTVTTAVGNFNI